MSDSGQGSPRATSFFAVSQGVRVDSPLSHRMSARANALSGAFRTASVLVRRVPIPPSRNGALPPSWLGAATAEYGWML